MPKEELSPSRIYEITGSLRQRLWARFQRHWDCFWPMSKAMTLALQNRQELACNVELLCSVKIDQCLNHPSVRALFDRLRNANRISGDPSWDDWREMVLTAFREKLPPPPENPKNTDWLRLPWLFKFRVDRTGAFYSQRTSGIGDDLVWSDETPVNFLATKLGIPFKSVNVFWDKDKEAVALRQLLVQPENPTYSQLCFRVVVFQGILKLQVGEFNEHTSSLVGKYDHRVWDTIASFPLLYLPDQHHLPERLLRIDGSGFPPLGHKRLAKRWQKDELQLRRDLLTYRGHEFWFYPKRQLRFGEVAARWLAEEGFKDADGYGEKWYEGNQYFLLRIMDLTYSTRSQWNHLGGMNSPDDYLGDFSKTNRY